MSLTTEEKVQLESLLTKLKQSAKPTAATAASAGLTISKDDFRTKGTAVLTIAGLLASLTPTPKDDIIAGLLMHLFSEQEHFDQICAMLGIA